MTLLKWIFHKDINPSQLRQDLGKLAELFEDYILSFQMREKHPYHASVITENLHNELAKEKNLKQLIDVITKHNKLTPAEKKRFVNLQGFLIRLRENLGQQVKDIQETIRVANKLEKALYAERAQLHNQETLVWERLSELVKEERRILFGTKKKLGELKEFILQNKEFVPLLHVSAPAMEAAKLANKYGFWFGYGDIGMDFLQAVPTTIAARESKTLFYPAAGCDLTPLFCFPNVKVYILQDHAMYQKRNVKNRLEAFARTNIIQKFRTIEYGVESRYSFTFNGQRKILVAYLGARKGNCWKYIPPEIRNGCDVFILRRPTGLGTAHYLNEVLLSFIKRGSYLIKDSHPGNVSEEDLASFGFKKLGVVVFEKE